jgi:hypothetical protein
MQPIRNKEKVKNRFSLVLEFWEAVSGNSKPAIVNFWPLPKKIGKYLVWVGRIRTSKACPKLKRCFKKFKSPTFHVSTYSTMPFSGRSSLARRSLKARKLAVNKTRIWFLAESCILLFKKFVKRRAVEHGLLCIYREKFSVIIFSWDKTSGARKKNYKTVP